MPLTDTSIKNVKPTEKTQKISDGGGLYLQVEPSNSKLWRLAYRFLGKQKVLALGAYPAVSLAAARKKRDEAKATLATGTDPGELARLEKIKAKVAAADTFGAVADEFLAKVRKEGRADATMVKKEWLVGIARADLENRPIAQISAAEILATLRKVEGAGNLETARRLRSTIGQVIRYAIATGRADNDPTGGLKGALTAPVVTHRAAITDRTQYGELLKAIWAYRGAAETRAALMLMVYLYPRPGELRAAEWQEFDLKAGTWTIPAARTKMRREHRKPLPTQAVAILKDMHKLTGTGRFVFPALHTRLKPMSENTMNVAIRRMGFTADDATSHGFRASASSLLNESGLWAADAIEAELAHIGADQVRRAYARSLFWEERVRMAIWWAKECDQMRTNRKGRDNSDLV